MGHTQPIVANGRGQMLHCFAATVFMRLIGKLLQRHSPAHRPDPSPPRLRIGNRNALELTANPLGTAEVSRVRLSGCGLIDLFAEDVAVACVPGKFFDHGEQGPSHADFALAGIVLGVIEVEAGRNHS